MTNNLIRVLELSKKIQVSKKPHGKRYFKKSPLLDYSCVMSVKKGKIRFFNNTVFG